MKFPKPPKRIKSKPAGDEAYLKWLRTLPCICTGRMVSVESHHLLNTGLRGMALKSPDRYAIPLDAKVHRELHNHGCEETLLAKYGIPDGMMCADELYELFLNKDWDGAYDYIIQRFI